MRERVWQVAIPFLFGKFFVRVTASKIPSGLLQRCVAFNLQNLRFEILQELWKKCLTYREGYSIFSFVGNMQHARVAQRWSTSLPRRGSRVRSPSRALEYKNRYPFGYLFFCIRDTSVSQSSIVSASLRSVQYRGSTFHFGRCWANVPRTFSTPGPRAPSPAFFIFWTLIYIRVTSISVTFCYDTNRK